MRKAAPQALVRLQTYVPEELVKKVEAEAQENHRPIAGEIWYILEQYFKQQEAAKQEARP